MKDRVRVRAVRLAAIVVALFATARAAAAAPAACSLTTTDSAWIANALSGWRRVSARAVRRPVARYPVLVLFDAQCTHTLSPVRERGTAAPFVSGAQRFAVASASHGDSVRLVDGSRIPTTLTSFAMPQKDGGMWFVMSLPSIWMAQATGERRDLLATAVFMHEFTHTQNAALGQRVDLLARRGLPDDVDDDIIQTRFGALPEFKAAYDAELDAVFQGVAAPTSVAARVSASKALALMDRRRAATFTGADAVYGDAEDIFLAMEGAGQWFGYLWLVDPRGGAMTATEALPFMRRGGRHWSQDEGLGLVMLLSRLDPAAPSALFARKPWTILPLLRRSVRGPRAP